MVFLTRESPAPPVSQPTRALDFDGDVPSASPRSKRMTYTAATAASAAAQAASAMSPQQSAATRPNARFAALLPTEPRTAQPSRVGFADVSASARSSTVPRGTGSGHHTTPSSTVLPKIEALTSRPSAAAGPAAVHAASPVAPEPPKGRDAQSILSRARWRKAGLLLKTGGILTVEQNTLAAATKKGGEMDQRVLAAAAAWDERQRRCEAQAERIYHELDNDPMSPRRAVFNRAVREIHYNRYIPPERLAALQHGGAYKRSKKDGKVVRKTYSPYDKGSVWYPRLKWCDGKDLYDHDDVKLERFEIEWQRAMKLGLERLIMRYDDDAAFDDDGDGVPDEVEEVAGALWQFRDAWQLLFAYYAASDSSSEEQMSLNEWSRFVEDCELVDRRSKHCKKQDYDTMFIAIDTMGAKHQKDLDERRARLAAGGARRQREADKGKDVSLNKAKVAPPLQRARTVTLSMASGEESVICPQETAAAGGAASVVNGVGAGQGAVPRISPRISEQAVSGGLSMQVGGDQKKAFSRTEFLVALVHIAINKYVLSGRMSDVSDAISKLFTVDIQPRIGVSIPVPDFFRYRHAYTEDVDKVLRKNYESLTALFSALCDGAKGAAGLLSLSVWLAFLRNAYLLGEDISERDGMLCFLWSRMVVIDDKTIKGHMKWQNLAFEGFMEALCRVARLKALPTEEEILHADCPDAGAFILKLKETAGAYTKWYEGASYEEWGDEANDRNRLSMHKKVDMLINIISRTIECESSATGELGNANLSKHEISKWMRGRLA